MLGGCLEGARRGVEEDGGWLTRGVDPSVSRRVSATPPLLSWGRLSNVTRLS